GTALLTTLLAVRSLLLAGLALLARLLALLTLLALLPVLLLVVAAILEIFHLLTELFGFAAQHLLLVLALSELLRIELLLLTSEIRLAARELTELLHRVIELLLRLLLGAAARARVGLVLVLLFIELEI